jgi:hypothetical protein
MVLARRKISTPILRGDRHGAEETQRALIYDTYLRQEEGHLKEHRGTENGGNLLCGLGTMIKNKTGGSLALQSHSSLRLWVRRDDTEHPCILVYPVFTNLCTVVQKPNGDQVFVFIC